MFQEQIDDLQEKIDNYNPQKKILRDLDIFVLDNSLRETTVGQLRGHTIEDKWKIFNEVKRVGFQHVIVESFNHRTRLGDTFIEALKEQGEDMSQYFAFSEFIDKIDKDKVPIDHIPIGLQKMKKCGINNVVIEFDLVYHGIDYSKFTATKMCDLIKQRIAWVRENLSPDSKIFFNIRDFTDCMKSNPRRLFGVVHFLASMAPGERVFGIAYEDLGHVLPEEMGVWTSCVREEMNRCHWENGHLIVHIHEQWGMCNVVQLECLANGATGIWAGLCEEGAAMGHASSCNTLFNLIRLGNEHILKKFHCSELRSASRAVTEITTGFPPHQKTPICGARALDLVFGLQLRSGRKLSFNLHKFINEEPEIRISNMATNEMIIIKLEKMFGKNIQFIEKIADRMMEVMLQDLHNNRKEEYNSAVGLAVLFARSGGECSQAMSDAIAKSEDEKVTAHEKLIMEAIRRRWDYWDARDGKKDNQVEFFAFYNGFMAPYFSSYREESTLKALQALDMDKDGNIDWDEFALYLKWAIRQYPEVETAQEIVDIAFTKGIIPAMQDMILNECIDIPFEDDVFGGAFYPRREYDDDTYFFGPQLKMKLKASHSI